MIEKDALTRLVDSAVRCPHCLHGLDRIVVEKRVSTAYLDNYDTLECVDEEVEDVIDAYFRCPYCEEKITDNSEEAEDFLMGKPKWRQEA